MFDQIPHKIVQTNRLPFLTGIIIFIFIMAVFIFKAQKNQSAEKVREKPHQSIDISTKDLGTSWFNDAKFNNIKIDHNQSSLHKQSIQEIGSQMISKQEVNLKKEEIEDEYSAKLEIRKIEDKDRIESKKLELEAMKSPLGIEIPGPPGGQDEVSKQGKTGKNDLSGEFNELVNMVRSITGSPIPSLASLKNGLNGSINNQDGKQTFLRNNDSEDDYLKSSKTKPRSPYEVKAGSYISAALITGINSDLPGNVNAQVIEDVFDSVTGNYLLIPQGAKLIGEYNSDLTFGQKRVQVVWNRIIYPDGSSIDLDKMQGVDTAGNSGYQDKVDNHYLRIYGNAVLLSLMGAGYDILNQKAEQTTDPRETVAASVGQKLADVSGQSLEKNMDIQPTLIIDPGYKFKIMVMKDMILENIEDAQGTFAYTK